MINRRSCLLTLLAPAPSLALSPARPASGSDLPGGRRELLQAGQLLRDTPVIRQAFRPRTALQARSGALRHPAAVQALRLLDSGLEQGLQASASSARPAEQEIELLGALFDLLILRIDVSMAEGVASASLDSLQKGLLLAHSIFQAPQYPLGLHAASRRLLHRFAAHLGMLSTRDLARLGNILQPELQLPPERRIQPLHLHIGRLLRDEAAASPAPAEARRDLDEFLERLGEQAVRPAWLRAAPEPAPASPAAPLLRPHLADLEAIFTHEAEWRALIGLLAVSARIEIWRWNRQSVPAGLDLLELGEQHLDPLTGKPFLYRTNGFVRYRLESPGLPPPMGGAARPVRLNPDSEPPGNLAGTALPGLRCAGGGRSGLASGRLGLFS